MEIYTLLRYIADSWFLLAMFTFFIGAGLYAWRPGSRGLHADAANVPFRNEDVPIVGPARTAPVSADPEVRS